MAGKMDGRGTLLGLYCGAGLAKGQAGSSDLLNSDLRRSNLDMGNWYSEDGEQVRLLHKPGKGSCILVLEIIRR